MPIEYSEYTSLLDVITQSNQDNGYQAIMSKENKALDTVNRTIKYYRDEDIKKKQFVNLTLMEATMSFLNSWINIIRDLINTTDASEIPHILTKEDRIFYVGIMLIIVSFLYFIIDVSS